MNIHIFCLSACIRTESDRADISYRGTGETIGFEQELKHWAASSSGTKESNNNSGFVRSNPKEDEPMPVSEVMSETFLLISITSKRQQYQKHWGVRCAKVEKTNHISQTFSSPTIS